MLIHDGGLLRKPRMSSGILKFCCVGNAPDWKPYADDDVADSLTLGFWVVDAGFSTTLKVYFVGATALENSKIGRIFLFLNKKN